MAQARKEAAAAPKISGPPVKEAELLKAHGKIREHFSTRFNDVRRGSPAFSPAHHRTAPLSPLPPPSLPQVRRGFRLLDEDKSGTLTRQEMRSVLMMFNLDIEARLIEKLIDLADQDGERLRPACDLCALASALHPPVSRRLLLLYLTLPPFLCVCIQSPEARTTLRVPLCSHERADFASSYFCDAGILIDHSPRHASTYSDACTTSTRNSFTCEVSTRKHHTLRVSQVPLERA